MFSNLADSLDKTFRNLRGVGKISESNITDALRDIRLALLEADVEFSVAKDFIGRVKEKAMGADVFKSIKPGDIISVAGTYGWVTALGGRYVSVVTRDGVEHLIPNETLISQSVENWTHTQRRTRLKLDVGVHHDSDVKAVIALCEEAARAAQRVLPDPAPKCLLIELGESSLKLQLRFWIGDAQNGVQNVKSDVLLEIWQRFKQHGVRVPYPQRDLHIRSSAERAPLQALG